MTAEPEIRESRGWIERACSARVVEHRELVAGAGARRYWRFVLDDARTAILMHAVPERREILPPALRAERDGIPFVEVSEYLERHGAPVPRILAVEPARRWVLLEDLGDRHLCDLGPPELDRRLEQAVDLLVRVHGFPREDALPFRRALDTEWVRFELESFIEHGLLPEQRADFAPELESLAIAVAGLPRTLCLRDYQSQNLMIDGRGCLRILDYQDALMAPRELDLAALLFDSYLDIGPDLRARLLGRYAERTQRAADPAALALLVVQRKCKDLGRFNDLARRGEAARWRGPADRARAAVLDASPQLPPALERLAHLLMKAFRP